MPILATERLTKRYGRLTAVDSLDLVVEPGDIYGFLGVNGAGKTTTLRMILRLIRPTMGRVWLFDQELRGNTVDLFRRMGALVELPASYPYLSAYQNLRVLNFVSGSISDSRIVDVLKLVGLADRMNDRVSTYSQGMRQRLGLAMALLNDPELVILDEPTNGLDPQGINDIRGTLLRLNRERGATFLISSHLLHEIEMTCNRVGIIKQGRLIVQERVDRLLAETARVLRVRAEPKARAQELLSKHPDVQSVREGDDGSLRLVADPARFAEINAALVRAEIAVGEFAPQRLTLEEYFLSK